MTTKVYCDTNIFISLWKPEEGNKWVNFYDQSFELFRRLKAGDYLLVISNWLTDQIKIKGFEKEFDEFLSNFPESKIMHVKVTSQIKTEANKYDTEHEDAVHALIAKKNGATHFITRNFQDFYEFENKLSIKSPEEF
jgi:predicted nucleic acid-binding protein